MNCLGKHCIATEQRFRFETETKTETENEPSWTEIEIKSTKQGEETAKCYQLKYTLYRLI